MGRAVRRDRCPRRQRRRGQPARAAARRGGRPMVPGRAGRRRRRPVPRALPRPGRAPRRRRSAARARRSRRSTAHGGRAIVVTGKYEPNARLHLEHLGIAADECIGWLWGEQKAVGAARARRDRLRRRPRRDSSAPGRRGRSVGVATGPVSADELRDAGADVVLTDLTEFPAWLDATCSTGGSPTSTSRCARSARWWWRSPAVPTRRSCWRPPSASWAPSTSSPRPRCSQRCRRPSCPAAAEFAAGLGVRHLTPATDEMEPRGLPGQRRRPLLLLQGRAARRAHAAGRPSSGSPRGHRDERRRRRRRVPARHPGRGRARRRHPAARRRADQGAGPGGAAGDWGLVTWDKPAAACLSSRIAYGIEITPARLARVERAEAGAPGRAGGGRHRGAATCGCATSATGARVEVTASAVAAVTARRPLAGGAGHGFAGSRSTRAASGPASMNELLP